MKPNLKIVKSSTGSCRGCFYLGNFECKKERVKNEILSNSININMHCINNKVIYIETPRHATPVPDSK